MYLEKGVTLYSVTSDLQGGLVWTVCLLLQVSVDALVAFLDDFNQHIFEMVTSNDINEKKGGIYAISKYWKRGRWSKRVVNIKWIKEMNHM